MKDFNCVLLQPLNYSHSLAVNGLRQYITAHAHENKGQREKWRTLA